MSDLRTRILTVLLLLVVFVGGAVAGVVVDRTWLRPRRARRGDRTERLVERFKRRLELDDAQVKRVRALLSSGRKASRSIRETIAPKLAAQRQRTRDEIVKVLNPTQRERYLEMVKRYEKRRAARRKTSK